MKVTFSAKFGLFAEIEAAGYHHGATFFYGLKKAGRSSSKQEGASWLPTADRARKATRFDIVLTDRIFITDCQNQLDDYQGG